MKIQHTKLGDVAKALLKVKLGALNKRIFKLFI